MDADAEKALLTVEGTRAQPDLSDVQFGEFTIICIFYSKGCEQSSRYLHYQHKAGHPTEASH